MFRKIFLYVLLSLMSVSFVGCNFISNSSKSDSSDSSATSSVTTSLPSSISANHIDYNQYLKKVWVVKSWGGGAHNYNTSFCITKIENGVIEGEFCTGAVACNGTTPASPPFDMFSGTIKNGVVELLFKSTNVHSKEYSDENGDRAKVTLNFKDENELEANIVYSKRLNDLSFINGNYLYRPYNFADTLYMEPQRKRSFSVNLDYWGNIKIITAVISSKGKIYPVAYLTNENNDILFEFYVQQFEIANVAAEDINGDGLKDIIFSSTDTDFKQAKQIFYQKDNGIFYDSKLNVK